MSNTMEISSAAAGLASATRLAVIGLSTIMRLGIHHVPFTQRLLDIGAIGLRDRLLSIGLGLLPLMAIELWKGRDQRSRLSNRRTREPRRARALNQALGPKRPITPTLERASF